MRKKVFLRILLLAIVVFVFLFDSSAQTRVITGIVSDQNGTPLSNATARVTRQRIMIFRLPIWMGWRLPEHLV